MGTDGIWRGPTMPRMGDMLPGPVQRLARNAPTVICAIQTLAAFHRLSNDDRGLSIGLILALGATWGVVGTRRRGDWIDILALVATIGIGAWMHVLTHNGQAFVAGYSALFVAPFWYPLPASLLPWACGVASITFSTMFVGRHDIGGGLGNGVGATFLGLAALFWGRVLRSSHANAELVVELQESRDAEQRSAVVAERARLARELHDVLAHTLSSLSLHLESTRVLAKSRQVDGDVLERIDRAVALARTGLEEARDAVGTLRDEELPSPERLPSLVTEFQRDSGLTASFEETGTPVGLSPEARVALFRAAQEALTNVVKHANATRVEVRLDWQPTRVELSVSDDGTGDGPTLPGGGNGLRGMRERAELVGGEMSAGGNGHGFTVEVRLPVTAGADGQSSPAR